MHGMRLSLYGYSSNYYNKLRCHVWIMPLTEFHVPLSFTLDELPLTCINTINTFRRTMENGRYKKKICFKVILRNTHLKTGHRHKERPNIKRLCSLTLRVNRFSCRSAKNNNKKTMEISLLSWWVLFNAVFWCAFY